MRADLDTLIPDAGRGPDAPLDAEALWARGRRRRAVRQVSAAGGSLAGIAALALVASSLVGGGVGTAVPEIEPMAPPADTAPEAEASDDERPDADDPTDTADPTDPTDAPSSAHTLGEERTAAEQRRLADSRDQRDRGGEPTQAEQEESTSGGSDTSDASGGDGSTTSTDSDPQATAPTGPTPDWSVTDDPCAIHDADQMRAFVDVASPVDGQQMDDPGVALVGCSSVFEATVRYRITQGSTVIVDDFVTATAGGPELGEFRQWIDLSTTGTHTLEVFWDSPKDGEGERDKTTLSFHVN